MKMFYLCDEIGKRCKREEATAEKISVVRREGKRDDG